MAKKPYIKRKKDYRKWAVSIIMSLIFVLSTIAFIMSFIPSNNNPNDLTFEYNNVKIKYDVNNQIYYIEKPRKAKFLRLPDSALALRNSSQVLGFLNNSQVVVISFDPTMSENDLTFIDYLRFFYESQFAPSLVSGTLAKSNKYNLPLVNCENATSSMKVIELIPSDNFSISFNENCMEVRGTISDFAKIYDITAYYFAGVLQ